MTVRQDTQAITLYADDVAVVRLISHNNQSEYRQEVGNPLDWHRVNNPCIDVGRAKEMTVDFRRRRHTLLLL